MEGGRDGEREREETGGGREGGREGGEGEWGERGPGNNGCLFIVPVLVWRM